MWEWEWLAIKDGVYEEIPTVTCADLIDSWTDLKLDERAALKAEFLNPENSLCPNTTSFQVKGGSVGDTNLSLMV